MSVAMLNWVWAYETTERNIQKQGMMIRRVKKQIVYAMLLK